MRRTRRVGRAPRSFGLGNSTRLANEREKILKAYHADVIPLEMPRKEQERLDGEVAQAKQQLALARILLQSAKKLIEVTLELLGRCDREHKNGSPKVRRVFNQAFFRAIHVKDREIVGAEHKEPFAATLMAAKGSTNFEEPLWS